MRWKWLSEEEYRDEATAVGMSDPRFLDPAFPSSSRRCFQVKAKGQTAAGVVCRRGKQLILGGVLGESPASLELALRFYNRLMWRWGCRRGWLAVRQDEACLPVWGKQGEIRSLKDMKKSGRCREGACRIEWVRKAENFSLAEMRCHIDPQIQIHRLEARIMTYKEAEVRRRSEAIAQIHHWNQLAQKAGPMIDAGGLRFVCLGSQAWISTFLPSPYAADPQYLRDQLARQLAELHIDLQPQPPWIWIECRRRLFMPKHQKGRQRHQTG